ncbi:LRR receptor-like serine/threonine-protein kinase FLS2 [Sesamum indicum]|uniref:LRR receptor-like serine/threonine-protein kinase FLS2 n=1 Tax=Sesamum indicum TaxID=4182 RepID=A0A6I9UK16_SESIN|nr:LRR receptor-like serine/threonine-protein kinase FLS2 [Sesamum indicum]
MAFSTVLKYLDLTGVNISEATTWLQVKNNLPSLVDLHLSRCGLRLITSVDFVNFTSLRVLDLSGNNFNSFLPYWFSTTLQNMTRLRYLNLSSNNFNSTVPNWFTRFRNLEVLSIEDNLVREGMLPESLGKLCRLEEIYLSRNRFSGDIQQAFTGCISRSLPFLYLGSNKFSGQIPKNLGELSKLQERDLVDNNFSGPLPVSLGQLQELEYLVISLNLLEGSVSEAHFRNLSRLKILRANGNKLIFKPSRNWSPPFQLRGLSLRTWQLGLKFPIWIKHMRHLNYLSLARMGIVDAVPAWFWTSTSQLSNNAWHKNMLEILNLRSNSLSGEIPDCWMTWPLIRVLRLDANRLTGKMLSSILTGRIPEWINRLSNLVVFNLRLNEFQGNIPPKLCHLSSLQTLDMAGNNLSGRIPRCFNNFSMMAGKQRPTDQIYYSTEDTFGGVPDSQFLVLKGRFNEYSNILQFVLTLDLSDNSLSGSIPVEVTRIVQVQALNLSRNSLTGSIPDSIGGMVLLESLNVSRNQLSGEIP